MGLPEVPDTVALANNPAGSTSAPLRSVQALRALAALSVVIFHCTVLRHDKFDPGARPWENGNSGVDLFFVISGFIMTISSQRLLARPDGWRQFMTSRLVRVVPMYWLVTGVKLAAVLALPALALHTRPTGWNVVASFLFIPAHDALGVIRPVLDVGWTLSFEMLFYVVFATALFLVVRPLLLVGPVMAALALASLAATAGWPAFTSLADPIVLEFVFGLMLGSAFLAGGSRRVASGWIWPLSLAGLLCLVVLPVQGRWERVGIWGTGAAAMLCASLLSERWIGRRIPDLVVLIGEASYSLYLTHGLVLPLVALLLLKSGLPTSWSIAVLIPVCLIASSLFAVAVFRWIETPVTAWLRRLTGRRRMTNLKSVEASI